MISEKDVVTLKMPFPNISSTLAVKSHMYICNKNQNGEKKLLKAQTYKPILENILDNYLIEDSDINRNPFSRCTLIDLDKRFCINSVFIPTNLRTANRANISSEFYEEICRNITKIRDEFIKREEFLECNTRCY